MLGGSRSTPTSRCERSWSTPRTRRPGRSSTPSTPSSSRRCAPVTSRPRAQVLDTELVPGLRRAPRLDRPGGRDGQRSGRRSTRATPTGWSSDRTASCSSRSPLAALPVIVVVSTLIARSIIRPVKQLTAAAERAEAALPGRCRQRPRRRRAPSRSRSTPVEVDAGSEFASLAAALNQMQTTAVQLATEQAQTRRNVSTMLANLARRNQSLLNRTLSFISQLEENERDPQALENLFKLDHLATRMRRNAESLLVLAGSDPPRTWPRPDRGRRRSCGPRSRRSRPTTGSSSTRSRRSGSVAAWCPTSPTCSPSCSTTPPGSRRRPRRCRSSASSPTRAT